MCVFKKHTPLKNEIWSSEHRENRSYKTQWKELWSYAENKREGWKGKGKMRENSMRIL